MIYDLSKDYDRQRAQARLDSLAEKGALCELKCANPRSSSQNSYLHLLIGIVAYETGVRFPYAKEEYYKRLCNRDIFEVDRNDYYAGRVKVLRSSSELTTEEMSVSIERLKAWAASEGIYLPNSDDDDSIRAAQRMITNNRNWL